MTEQKQVHELSISGRLGGGGHATVFLLADNKALKAIKVRSECDDEKEEFDFQGTIHREMKKLKSLTTPSKWESLTALYVNVPKPYKIYSEKLIIDDDMYECGFVMKTFKGLTVKDILELNPSIETSLSPEFIASNMEKRVLIHLSMNSELSEKIFSVEYNRKMIERNDSLRGYFISISEGKSPVLNALRSSDRPNGVPQLKLSNSEMSNIMGFVYATMFYHMGIVPLDIEFVLFIDENELKIGMLDFGMAIDTRKPSTWNKNITYKRILERQMPIDSKIKSLRKQVMHDIGVDLYCSLDVDEQKEEYSGFDGWMSVENEFSDITVPFRAFI